MKIKEVEKNQAIGICRRFFFDYAIKNVRAYKASGYKNKRDE